MTQYDIAIVGGGAAGLMAAARCVGSGLNVILVEKNRECGKKILITGKGRCNITNISPWREFQSHIHPDKGFVKNAFHHFSNTDVVNFIESTGLQCKEERGNRIFPVTDRSHDVRDHIVKYINKGGVKISCGTEVTSITKSDDKYVINMVAPGGDDISVLASKVILT